MLILNEAYMFMGRALQRGVIYEVLKISRYQELVPKKSARGGNQLLRQRLTLYTSNIREYCH